jgi:rare lipoprotein A
LADRYTGRHIRQARHGAWVTKKRSRSRSAQAVPTAAALTVAGVLIGGAGTVIQLGAPAPSTPVDSPSYDAASYPIQDRAAAANRVSRTEGRTAEAAAEQPPTTERAVGIARVVAQGNCEVSYNGAGQRTASGEAFDPNALTAASKTLPFGTQVRVTNEANGESVVVRINDRGPYVDGRCLSLSEAAFGEIAKLGAGVVDAHYEVLAQDAT